MEARAYIVFIVFCVNYSTALLIQTRLPEGNISREISDESGESINKLCKTTKEYNACARCYSQCDNSTNQNQTICHEDCRSGCFCKNGLSRDKHGNCVTQCLGIQKTSMSSVPLLYQLACSAHQVYDPCRKIETTCTGVIVPVNKCLAGCFCRDGYIKAPDGQCVLLKDCPKPEVSVNDDHLTIEECQPDEVFVWCGWCEGSCSEPTPHCPAGACTRGCLCRPPLLRHYSGHCVAEQDCLPRNCSSANEEYICQYGCEPRCKSRACLRARRCRLGCHCKRGLLRSEEGTCVTKNQCFFKNNATLL